jgi:hypothetical protein
VSRALLAVLAVGVGAAATADPTLAHRAVGIRLGDHPAFVRVVVDFVEGPLRFHEAEATDPFPFGEGRARLRVTFPRIRTQAAPVTALGVSVRVSQGTNEITVHVAAQPRRFKYVAYFVLSDPDRLVIDLWKAAPPTPAAVVRVAPDGCLTLDRFSVLRERVTAAGRERNLFEHSHVVRVRGSDGRVVAERPVTSVAGRWTVSFPYRVTRTQPGTLEAAALSARDGALDCIVQARVTLRP